MVTTTIQAEVLTQSMRHAPAWHHRNRYQPGAELRRRWDLASPSARARGQAANRRLHTRWAGFDSRKKRPVVANVAIARELAGWCWSLAVMPD
jgi:transposase